jgi:hypothetical protein
MSRFKHLLGNVKDIQEEVLPNMQSLQGDITFTSESFTHAPHATHPLLCATAGCKEPLAYIIDPEYSISLGIKHSIPLGLLFTALPSKTVAKEDLDPSFKPEWATHALAVKEYTVVTCPACGEDHPFQMAEDGGIISPNDPSKVMTPIPRNRVKYLTTPAKEWDTKPIR